MTKFLKGGLAATILASTMAAAPAIANDEVTVTVAYVEYRDLDLSTQEGQDRLHNRLRRAARYACGMDEIPTGSLLPRREARACYAENLQSFERRIATLVEAETRRG